MAPKSFDKVFKLEAVNLVVNQKRPVTAVARELAINWRFKKMIFDREKADTYDQWYETKLGSFVCDALASIKHY